MGRKLEPHSITTMRSLSDRLEKEISTGMTVSPKQTLSDEIKQLSQMLLKRLKQSTSISNTHHMISVVTNLDQDGIERLYFHIQNMNYGEYHSQQQDCYGRIDEQGIVELFKSRDKLTSDFEHAEEAYSSYSPEDRARVEEFKKIMADRLKAIEEEKDEYFRKSFFGKMFSRILGKDHISQKKIVSFITKLPEKLQEKARETSFAESIRVDESSLEGQIEQSTEKQTTEQEIDDDSKGPEVE